MNPVFYSMKIETVIVAIEKGTTFSPCFTRSLKPGNCHVRAKNPQCQTKNVARDPQSPNTALLLLQFGVGFSDAKHGIESAYPYRTRPDTCELLIFRKSVTSDALVNLHGSDEKYMEAVVKWYVLVFCTLAVN